MSNVVIRPANAPRINAADVAIKYATDVINGEIVAGKLTKLAAIRFIRDLEFGGERHIYFNPEAAQHVVDFFGSLCHSKGEWGGKPFVLSPWQVFILANIFGWRYRGHPEYEDETRRFREIYIEVARKNGKSTFMAGIGLYLLVADGEPGAEIYSAATKKDQAKIVFEEAVRMRKASQWLAQRVAAPRNNLNVVATNSKFEPLSSEDSTLDGLNASGVLVDELHAHPTRKLYDVLFESTKARRQPLTVAITTAGYNRQGVCYAQREIACKILEGITEAAKGDAIFAFIACMDEKDDAGKPLSWRDERNWQMANPNLGVSVKLTALREAANKAEADPTALNSFLRKHLNIWTNQDVRWMPPIKWAACNEAGTLVSLAELRKQAMEKLAGRVCFGGLDLSSKIDMSAFVLVFPPVPELKTTETKIVTEVMPGGARRQKQVTEEKVLREADPKWYVLPWFFVPQECVAERVKKDRVDYDVWIREGFISTTPGASIDQEFIRSTINAAARQFKMAELGFDSWNASQVANELKDDGLTVVEVRQGYRTLSEPMKEVMGLVLDKKLEHFGNPVLSWCVLNVQATQDPAGNIKPDKEHSKEKIDGAVAMIMALHRVTENPNAAGYDNPYNRRGIVFI